MTLECGLCPRRCRLKDGQKGFCLARERQGEKIVLAAGGKISGLCVDPIEKKPLYHFLPGTGVLSFGTTGCNLACKFCQNWHLSRAGTFEGEGVRSSFVTCLREVTNEDLTPSPSEDLTPLVSPAQIAIAALANVCPSVAFTYNEPIVFFEYAIETAEACHKAGIKTVAVTNGYICREPRKEFFQHIGAANVDLKGFNEDFYQKFCGGHLKDVLDTLVYLKKTGVWLEITNLIIPGANDSVEEIREMCRWIVQNLGPDVPLHFSAFYPAWKMTTTPPTPPSKLKEARQIALTEGISYVYTGNIRDDEGQNTYCAKCGTMLISRQGYRVEISGMDNTGRCKKCAFPCVGVFSLIQRYKK
ncbi:MAG: AmmeMemoRadiSam system radical SAM enzyme [Elusimicrobia bacterium]|nr:AmmeMemoRadiSam system radical SAM enzyme [Elusimicrobiota bacterium]